MPDTSIEIRLPGMTQSTNQAQPINLGNHMVGIRLNGLREM